jgi:hypothetical protein
VLVREGAVDEGVPIRDLHVSPDLALSVEDDEGKRVLVPVLHLANGATILREPPVGLVTYVSVCLERHDILMGDGMAAEGGPGTGKAAAVNVVPLRHGGETAGRPPPPDLRPRRRADLCAPLLLGNEALAIHARLLARAKELGYAQSDEPELTVSADRTVIPATGVDNGTYLFRLPPGTRSVRVASRSYVPVEADPATGDARRLGVALARLTLAGETLALSDEVCIAGFHPLEGPTAGPWRWTTGDATIALPPRTEESVLEIAIHHRWGRYWLPPEPRATEEEAAQPAQ